MLAANHTRLARHDVVPGLIRPGLTLLAGEDGQGRDAPAGSALTGSASYTHAASPTAWQQMIKQAMNWTTKRRREFCINFVSFAR